jgi:hypothetical protein
MFDFKEKKLRARPERKRILQKALKGCGFQGNSVDPCLWTKYTEHGIVFAGIYVNDYLVIGNEKDINDVIDGLKTYKFGLKIANDLKDYLSYRILTDYERKTTFVMQPHLINNLKEKFEKEVNNLSDYSTPGTPRFKIVRSTEETEKIYGNLQSKYRSGVGMLLYLIKYSRPDLANVVRELSKCMDGANLVAYKEMFRVVKFVLDTKDYCLKLNPVFENEEWDLVLYSDSDWAGNPENRISVTGFIIYLLGAPICWRSKGQKGVTLSKAKLNIMLCWRGSNCC